MHVGTKKGILFSKIKEIMRKKKVRFRNRAEMEPSSFVTSSSSSPNSYKPEASFSFSREATLLARGPRALTRSGARARRAPTLASLVAMKL